MRTWVQSLALLSGLRIWHCRELSWMWQMWRRSHVSVLWCRPAAVASIRPLGWEPPYAAGAAPQKTNKRKKTALSGPWHEAVSSDPSPPPKPQPRTLPSASFPPGMLSVLAETLPPQPLSRPCPQPPPSGAPAGGCHPRGHQGPTPDPPQSSSSGPAGLLPGLLFLLRGPWNRAPPCPYLGGSLGWPE